MNGVVAYVAGPYSGDIEGNIRRAEAVSINLIRKGFSVLTPHKNTAGYEKYEDGEITVKTWIEMDLNLLKRCDVMFIMKGWEKSWGTKFEIGFAIQNDIPIVFL